MLLMDTGRHGSRTRQEGQLPAQHPQPAAQLLAEELRDSGPRDSSSLTHHVSALWDLPFSSLCSDLMTLPVLRRF